MANPPSSDTGQLISPWDQRVYSIPTADHEKYKAAGWVPPIDDADHQEVSNAFSNWRQMGTAESAIYSASAGFIGLPSVIEKGAHALGHDDWAKNYADHVIMAQEQHPNIDTAARLTTGIGSGVLYAAAAAAAAPAIAGAAGLGAGAAAVGAGAAEAGALGAEALGGAAAAGEAAAGAAPEALSLGQRALQAAPSIAKLGGKLAAEGAAIGIVDRYDQAAIQHAASPEGQEKVVWSVADIARDAAVNGTLGLGLTGAAKALTGLGKKMGDGTAGKLVDALLDKVSVEQVAMQGRDGELRQMAKTVVPMGVERARVHVDNIIDLAEKDMNQLKYQIAGKGNYLDDKGVQKLKKLVDEQLGGTVEGANMLQMIEDGAGETERAKTFAPGDMAKRADTEANYQSKVSREKYIKDYNAEYQQRVDAHKGTKAYAEHMDRVSAEQERLNAVAKSDHAVQLAQHESQQARFINGNGVRMSPGEYQVKFGQNVPSSYYDAAPEFRAPKTAHVPFEPVTKAMPFEPPDISEMQPGERYQAMNDAYFDSMRKGDPTNVLNPQKLQDIRKAAYDMINFKNYGARPVDAKLRETGRILGDHIKELFTNADSSMGKQYATEWALKDEQYSAAQLLKSALRKGNDTLSFSGLFDKIVGSAGVGAAVGISGFMGGPWAAAKAAASYKAIQNVRPEHFFHFGQAMGGILEQADKRLSSTIMQRLSNTPAIVANVYSPAKYQEVAAKLAKIAQDPTQAASNTNQALIDAGLPHDTAQNLTGQLHGQNMYLTEQVQHQTGPADMPSLGHGDPVKLRKVVGQHETMMDPTHGLKYPTQANLEVLKKFYPQIFMTAQSAIYTQIRKNPRMSPAAKQWASRVLGRPINNLSSGGFSAMLQQSRAASQQAAKQAGGPSTGSRRRAPGGDTGSQTRLDELQGGN